MNYWKSTLVYSIQMYLQKKKYLHGVFEKTKMYKPILTAERYKIVLLRYLSLQLLHYILLKFIYQYIYILIHIWKIYHRMTLMHQHEQNIIYYQIPRRKYVLFENNKLCVFMHLF